MVFVMIWSCRALPFLVGFSMTMPKSSLLRISLYFKLMLSLGFVRFMLNVPWQQCLITTFIEFQNLVKRILLASFFLNEARNLVDRLGQKTWLLASFFSNEARNFVDRLRQKTWLFAVFTVWFLTRRFQILLPFLLYQI